ncbi:hypothetical protein FGADI_7133 [Fusarium gaditjirri]|uniref:Uncharacterized protein n=1 Tax=Fusarium gaditjirri TaxID=282569 RepID=A0A8H4T5W8_9HYPO|nr:hypothetical protein FGADI_7133 [Fusarium gaditjirri]
MTSTNSRIPMPYSFDLRAPIIRDSTIAVLPTTSATSPSFSCNSPPSKTVKIMIMPNLKDRENDSGDLSLPTLLAGNALERPANSAVFSQVQSYESKRLPFAVVRCESLLQWPALCNIIPSDARGVDSFPLSPGYKESSTKKQSSTGKGIDGSSFVTLCRKFLAHVHPRNPVLDGQQLIRHARTAEENGLKLDTSSCLVLLSCALAEYTDFWIKPNEYHVPPSREQLRQRDDPDQGPRAEPYYAAAQRRMGLRPSALESFSYPEPLPTPPEGLLAATGQTPRSEGSNIDQDEEQRHVDERGWYYDLSEISIRRTVDETLNLFTMNLSNRYRSGKFLLDLNAAYKANAPSFRNYHLPAAVQFEKDKLPEEEFASALQGRAFICQEYSLRPIFYYLLHCPQDDPVFPQVHPHALKELDICAKMIHRLAFQGRHGGTWLISRKIFLSARIVLAAASNPYLIHPPDQWQMAIELAIHTLDRWAVDTVDVRQMAEILRHMYYQV